MMVRVMLPIWLISWTVLLPLTSININGLDSFGGIYEFTFANIDPTVNRRRYIGFLVLTWIFTSELPA